MAIYLKTLEVEPYLWGKLQGWLDTDKPVPDCDRCETIHTFTLPMGRYEVDIKVCNGEPGPWIDAVIFENGCEIYAIEPSFGDLLGEYIFYIDGDEYWAILTLAKGDLGTQPITCDEPRGNDYTLFPDRYAWITLPGDPDLSVFVKHQAGEGAIVDIYPRGHEDDEGLLGTTWAHFSEAKGYVEALKEEADAGSSYCEAG